MLLQPMGADYVYDVNRMIDLAGGDLSSKRQAKNRFLRNYRYRVETYDAARHLILNSPGGESSIAGAIAWSIGVLVISIPAAAYSFRRLTR